MRHLIFALSVAAYLLSLMWIIDLAWYGLTDEVSKHLVRFSRLRF